MSTFHYIDIIITEVQKSAPHNQVVFRKYFENIPFTTLLCGDKVSLEQICFSAYEMEQLKLGRTWDEIMDSEFQSWRVLEGHAIPD